MRTNPWKTKDADAAETRNINYFCYVASTGALDDHRMPPGM
jgi:hypothetical protein